MSEHSISNTSTLGILRDLDFYIDRQRQNINRTVVLGSICTSAFSVSGLLSRKHRAPLLLGAIATGLLSTACSLYFLEGHNVLSVEIDSIASEEISRFIDSINGDQ